jgi:GNAT superfamily N-acetyltransferase
MKTRGKYVSDKFIIRNALPKEFEFIGNLLVSVYSQLDGFPKPDEQPAYYTLLQNVGVFAAKPGTEVIVAADNVGTIVGAVVYFADMQHYGSGGSATHELNSSGFRLLAVDHDTRGKGIGKMLTKECIARALSKNHKQVIIHSTQAMQTAWKMYQSLGFNRSADLDFMQGELPVFGFRLAL